MTQKHPIIHVRPKNEKDRRFWNDLFDMPPDPYVAGYFKRPRHVSVKLSNNKQANPCEISLYGKQ